MVDQLTQLTTAQRDRLPAFAGEWIATARSTTPLTEAEWRAWEAGMRGYYADAGRCWPGAVVRVGSPVVGALSAPAALAVLRTGRRPLRRRRAVNPAEVETAVETVLTSAADWYFRSSSRWGSTPVGDAGLRAAVAAAASAAVCAALESDLPGAESLQPDRRRSAWVKPRKLIPPEPKALRATVAGPVYREVHKQICWKVFQAVDLTIDLPVAMAAADSVPMRWRRTPLERSYSWPMVSAFFRDEANLPLTEDDWQRSRAYQDAVLTRWWWPTRDFVMVCDRPVELHVETAAGSHRLHNSSGPAIRWADGWALYFWHGTQVPAELIETEWGPEQILAEPNPEIRRCAIERLGWDRFASAAELTEVDRAVDPGNPGQLLRLYEVPGRLLRHPARVLVCTNATRERDGTRRSFGLTVPSDCPTALAGAAWTFDIAETEYVSLVRAT